MTLEAIPRDSVERLTGRFSAWRGAVSVLVSARSLTVAALALGVFLRVALAVVNRDSNDDHIDVVMRILTERRLPSLGDCEQCYQPKLYHLVVAAVTLVFPAPSPITLIVAGQMLNVVAGLATLWITWLFLRRFVPDTTIRAFAFSLTALNPDLASINGMATNDSFIILWSTMAIYGVLRFLETSAPRHLALCAVGAVLAPLSKGNGLVTAGVLAGALGVSAALRLHARAPEARRFATRAAVLGFVWLAIVPWAGQYLDNARRAGSPVAVRWTPEPWPNFFEQTYVRSPGITSVVHSFMTFRIAGLIMNPWNDTKRQVRYLHRTSLWSQLYGRAHFSHFAAQPQTWKQVHHQLIRGVGRAIMVLALVPTTLLLLGGVLRLIELLRSLPDVRLFLRQSPMWVVDAVAVAFLAFIVVYTARYRDYTVMKAIFILPGLLGFLHWFVRGYTAFRAYPGLSRVTVVAAIGSMIALLPLYTADLVTLILHIMGWM